MDQHPAAAVSARLPRAAHFIDNAEVPAAGGQPIPVVTGHTIPWNSPLQIFGRSVGGGLAAGNACVVKPAEDACLSVLRVAELAASVGFPAGAVNIVTGLGNEAGIALAEHTGIEHI